MIIYIKHLWIIKEVSFSAKSTTSGKGIEDGKLVILVGSFLCKYNLFITSLLFVNIWSITLSLSVKANISKTSWINVRKDTVKPNVRAFISLLDIARGA